MDIFIDVLLIGVAALACGFTVRMAGWAEVPPLPRRP
jgi:hypothetical protein